MRECRPIEELGIVFSYSVRVAASICNRIRLSWCTINLLSLKTVSLPKPTALFVLKGFNVIDKILNETGRHAVLARLTGPKMRPLGAYLKNIIYTRIEATRVPHGQRLTVFINDLTVAKPLLKCGLCRCCQLIKRAGILLRIRPKIIDALNLCVVEHRIMDDRCAVFRDYVWSFDFDAVVTRTSQYRDRSIICR